MLKRLFMRVFPRKANSPLIVDGKIYACNIMRTDPL